MTKSKPYTIEGGRENPKLPWKYLKTLAASQRQFTATIPVGHMRTSYWDVVAIQFEVNTKLNIIAEDGSFYGEYLVVACSRIHAQLVELLYVDIETAALQNRIPEDYVYAWKGNVLRHCVLRTSDNEIVVQEMASKQECMEWIAAKMGSVAA